MGLKHTNAASNVDPLFKQSSFRYGEGDARSHASGHEGEEEHHCQGQVCEVRRLPGHQVKTQSGLKKTDLMKSKSGRIVSKKSNAAGKKAYKNIKGWTVAVQKARKFLKVKGFLAVKKGSPLYLKAKEFYQ